MFVSLVILISSLSALVVRAGLILDLLPTSLRVTVPDFDPAGAIGAQDPSHLLEDLNELGDPFLRGGLET
jgi:hypothetical protein